MEFVPKAPDDEVNVTREHPLKEAATLIFGLSLVFVLITALLVFFVDLVIALVPEETEARVLGAWRPDDFGWADDDERQADVERVLQRLLAHWPDAPYEFRVGVMDEEQPNALALPGGLIVVTRGLLDQVETENELAFVLGHELGHFRHRDHLRALGRGVALALLVSVAGGGDAGLDLSSTVTSLTNRGFGRQQETRADRFGLELVAAEYGHVADSWRFFERLAGDDLGLGQVVAYLSTHPAHTARIAELRDFAGRRGWPLEGPTAAWPGLE